MLSTTTLNTRKNTIIRSAVGEKLGTLKLATERPISFSKLILRVGGAMACDKRQSWRSLQWE